MRTWHLLVGSNALHFDDNMINNVHLDALDPNLWPDTPAAARAVQTRLAERVLREDALPAVNYVGGVDVHYPRKGSAYAAAVVLKYPSLALVDVAIIEDEAGFPYIPGLLSFREGQPAIKAVGKLQPRPDLLIADGQGIAHPRRIGLASHLGVLLDLPTIGCAKSRYWGTAADPAQVVGAWTPLQDGSETIGAVLRSKPGVNPLYVSIGHRVSLSTAIEWVLACRKGYRLPEPNRIAHLAAGRHGTFANAGQAQSA